MNVQKMIKIENLNVSRAYQRTVKRAVVAKIKKKYEKSAFGTVIVGERKDGTLWVIDGQQRMTAVKEMGHKEVPCSVMQSSGSSHEAEIFRVINGGRQNISRNELFKAALEAGDKQSVEIVAAVERSGFVLGLFSGSNSKPNVIRQAAPLERIYELGKSSMIEKVLRCIKSAWENDSSATKSFVLTGLAKFFRTYPESDEKRVIKAMCEVSPNHILRHADDARQLMGGNRDLVVSRVIAMQYNKRLKPINRLEVKESPSV
tara:strand:- start:64 stop:843 length:780 start_codon:yes stop_codon:yes gene_type:complete